jgi:FSR family fosmidomycin resistance protein-like MFS transporter
MHKRTVIVGTYSLLHAVVDMGCALLLAEIAKAAGADLRLSFLAVVAYDIIAFALQLPFGYLADKLNKNALVSAFGCILVAIGLLCSAAPYFAVTVAGIGNAFFHIGGGIDVLNISEGKATLPGVYVATGAMGLYLGTRGSVWSLTVTWMCAVLLAGALLLLWLYKKAKRDYRINNEPCSLKPHPENVSSPVMVIVLCLFLTICVRGGFGLVMKFPWNDSFGIGVVTVGVVVLGKALGGVIGDRLGWLRTSVTSLMVAAVLFAFADDFMVCGLLALFLFNITMPITLAAMAACFPNRKGMAFGITTFALVAGALPVFSEYREWFADRTVLIAATVVSAGLLWIGLAVFAGFIKNVSGGMYEKNRG